MSPSKLTGSCLCGKVKYEVTGDPKVFQYCHCSRCRKFTGSVHAANIFFTPEQFKWLSGEEFIGRFEPEDTKYFTTTFCKNCGSSLPWADKSKRAVVVPAGTLDTDPEIKPIHNVFWESRAPWFTDVSALVKYDELPTKKKN